MKASRLNVDELLLNRVSSECHFEYQVVRPSRALFAYKVGSVSCLRSEAKRASARGARKKGLTRFSSWCDPLINSGASPSNREKEELGRGWEESVTTGA